MRPRRRLAAKLALALSLCAAPALSARTAAADEKENCLAAASKGQTLRDAHDLVGARDQFRVCARNVCPALVQTDCGNWLDEVERRVPSVVLSAKDGEGHDLLDITVTADGAPLVRKLDGQAVPLNPGVHTFRFELASGESATSQALVKEGEKAQGIAVVLPLAHPGAKADASKVAVPAPAPVHPFVNGSRGATQRIVGLVLGGLGVVGLGVGAGVAIDAKSKDNAALAEEEATGPADARAAVNQGNIGTGVVVAGAVVAAAGIVLWVTAPRAKVALGVDGSQVLLRGVF
jgi:hypothetical protein